MLGIIEETQILYTVQPGDTLYSIASRFNSTVDLIQEANAIYPPITDPYLIYPGWLLVVPAPAVQPYRSIYIVQPGDTLFSIGRRFSAHYDLLAGVNQLADANAILINQPLWVPAFQYEIHPGDTLTQIASQLGISVQSILQANEGRPGFSRDLLYPAFRLIIPAPSSRNITVVRPPVGEYITSGVRVEGFARVFEANVLMQIRDGNHMIITNERFTTAQQGAPDYGYFSLELPFDQHPTTEEGELWVYDRSAEDGRIVDLVRVRVYFS